MAFIERDAVIDGVRLHYAEGPAAGPPVVLVPGQSMPWESYTKVLPALARNFHVYALDVRGHGRSQHTPGAYSFARCGQDLVGFLREVVRRPAICCGNSSGGLIALWAAAHAPERVSAVLAEDPPLFSAEWPRMRDDTWVHGFFEHVVANHADLARFFATLKLPSRPGKKLMSFPRPLAWLLGGAIRRRRRHDPLARVDIPWLPLQVRLFVRGLSEYDVDFTRACTDGRMCDMDHAACLSAVRCPMLLVQASSFRGDDGRLVGAMDDGDVARAVSLLPSLWVERLTAPHVVHLAHPRTYVRWVQELAARVDARDGAPAPEARAKTG